MKIHFTGKLEEVNKGIVILQDKLKYEICESGEVTVKVSQSSDCSLSYSVSGNTVEITYDKKVFFFRALSRALFSVRQGKDAKIRENSNFTMDGAMIDCSRNGVLSVKGAKEMLQNMACMGLDMLMLYTEDTYEVPDYPYFGHLRGRFSKDEIHEIDEYALCFGIELIPCIQTAAHLTNALKWRWAEGIQDMGDTLLEGSEDTYKFIEAAVKSCSEMFSTKKIHIGYDEAVTVGRGKHLDLHGYEPNTVILKRHLDRIKEILKKYGREPMMWGDMYRGMYEKDGVVEKDGMGIVYWDYYQPDEKNYLDSIDVYQKISNDIIFAGASWTWNTLIAPYFKTYYSTIPALRCCLARGIKRVFVTMWGDDGQETSWFAAMPGLQMYAEFRFCENKDDVTEELIAARFKECVNGDLEMFKELARIDLLREEDRFYNAAANPTKAILFQNPIFGPFDKDIEQISRLKNFTEHFNEYAGKMAEMAKSDSPFAWLFDFPEKLCRVCEKKWNIGLRLKAAYDADDKASLSNLAEELSKIKEDIKAARLAHRKQWFRAKKAQGWDSLDEKYGSLICQTDTAIERIKAYCDGTIDELEELKEERIHFYCEPLGDDIMGVTHYFLFGTGGLL